MVPCLNWQRPFHLHHLRAQVIVGMGTEPSLIGMLILMQTPQLLHKSREEQKN